MKFKYEVGTYFLIGVAIGLFIGCIIGASISLDACVRVGMRLTDITLNEEALNKLVQHWPEIQNILGA